MEQVRGRGYALYYEGKDSVSSEIGEEVVKDCTEVNVHLFHFYMYSWLC